MRPLRAVDLPRLHELWQQNSVQFVSKERSRVAFMRLSALYQSQQAICWLLEHREEKRVIGTCEFNGFNLALASTDIGCELAYFARGQGYMSEALRCLLEYAFTSCGLVRLYARIKAENQSSQRLFSGLGFEQVEEDLQQSGLISMVLSAKKVRIK